MHPIIAASRMMSDAQITRKASIHANAMTIYLWELSNGGTLEVVRSRSGFHSSELKRHPFDERLSYYSEKSQVTVTGCHQRPA